MLRTNNRPGGCHVQQGAGHPIRPMLVGFPVTCCTGTLMGFAVYAANGQQFWLNLAIALNIASVGTALLASLPGLADLAFGSPRGAAAKTVGIAHGSLSVAAPGLFGASLAIYATHRDGPATGGTAGLASSSAGLTRTLGSGFLC